MALVKTITTPHGVECSYHRILISEMDAPDCLEVRLASYVDEEKRKANCPPVWYQIFQLKLEKELVEKEDAGKTLSETIKSVSYRKLKQIEIWKDAEDK